MAHRLFPYEQQLGTMGAINLKDKISQFFTWGEFLRTDTGASNEPSSATHKSNLIQLAKNLDVLRTKFGPINITSGYRSPAVNAAIKQAGGAAAAQLSEKTLHAEGSAADITPTQTAATTMFAEVANNPALKKLFGEFAVKNTTIHASLPTPFTFKEWTPMWVNDANQYIRFQAAELADYIKKNKVAVAVAATGGTALLIGGAIALYFLVYKPKKAKK